MRSRVRHRASSSLLLLLSPCGRREAAAFQSGRSVTNEAFAVYLAAKDPRMPWYAKAVAFLTIAYAFIPDFIPDFIPMPGYLDDLLIVPAGIALAVRLIPPELLEAAR